MEVHEILEKVKEGAMSVEEAQRYLCLLYTSPSPRD